MLTIFGTGGIGKTRLALQAAADALPHFPQGVYFVPLAAISSSTLIDRAIANALAITFANAEDTLVQLIRYLREKRVLLVIDNFEHLLDGTSLLTTLLSGTESLKLLITSRERLNVQDEWVIALEGLNYPMDITNQSLEDYSAVQLFMQQARRVNAHFSLSNNHRSRECHLPKGGRATTRP